MQPQLPQPQPPPLQQQQEQQEQQHAWLDALSAPSVEQFRARVGALHRVPFRRHPPAAIPTMDSYYREKGSSSGGGGSDWMLCFPKIYAKGCVPAADQTRVDTEHACA